MNKNELFTSLRPLLHALAYQMLGNDADAKDMVQECFLRWNRARHDEVQFPKAYLTTIVTRLCLKHLQSARMHQEQCIGGQIPDSLSLEPAFDPADHARLAESLSLALLVLLQTLSPAERAVFLLREVFDCDYGEIASVLEKSEDNCRQILRRARERIAGRQSRFEVTPQYQEQTLEKFLQASASGNWRELAELLSADATLTLDGNDLSGSAPGPVHGAALVVDRMAQSAARWLPAGARLERLLFRGHHITVAYRDETPVSAILTSLAGDRIGGLCVLTCPVRVRTLLAQNCNLAAE